ncbi:hypothetical protein GR160_02820 [Flavobacterium sp. Sd200]|uniref:hypothetical protein n=1 Tax=Flavobacterium sp. Sd200 TaxID=2692211 RepID=UPI00137149A0|nr:hypothetical protein [Flavobacterium sp. Sd200]MXN90146.1 hypothetical protein [Flavobacterium sp. Sd200]
MEKYFNRSVVCWFLFLLLLAFMVSCGRKPMPGIDKATSDVSTTSRDSSAVTDRNLAIIDSLKAYIGGIRTTKPECDSVCQEAVDRALAGLNTQKTSGNNGYGIYYDKYNKLLVMYTRLAETKNEKTNVAKASTRTVTVTITRNNPVPYTPTYMKYSAWFGWAAAAFFIVRAYLKRTTWLPKIFT